MRTAITRRRLSLSLVVAALAVGAAPSAASADVFVIGEKVSGPGTACNGNNASNDHVKVCFQPDGEWLYVKDANADGRSAVGQISGRDRICRNPNGVGTWVRCNYSFREGSVVTFRGYTRDTEGLVNWDRDETPYTSDLA
jgi:hypothetical protein